MTVTIYYDGNCPFCSRYVSLIKLREAVSRVVLVDLRETHSARERLHSLGLDLDAGMVVDLDGQLYSGDAAAHRLALLSTENGWFNRLNSWLLGSRLGAVLVYPLLRIGRGLTLVALDRPPIRSPEGAGIQAQMTLFGMAWGLFAFLHVLVYAFQFNAAMYATTWAIAPLGVALIFYPNSRRLLLAIIAIMLVDAWRHLPMYSNHTLLKNVFLHALLLSAFWNAWRGYSWQRFLDDAAPIGRCALVCMYVFGVFHKLNTDFLDPEVSCATVLWQGMPPWLNWIGGHWFELLAIYGTLIIETVILLCLLVPRSRHLGIVLGIGFHSLLALSGYALYATFSMLTIAMHLLFVDAETARRVVDSPLWRRWMRQLRQPTGLALVAFWLALLAALAWNGSYSALGLVWLPAVMALCYILWVDGRGVHPVIPNLIWSRLWWVNVISVLMFATCFKPYLGLPTAQSMNMFANLRLEAGVSNHLVFRDAPGPFGYLSDVVELVDSGGSSYLGSVQREGLQVTWYDLLDKLERYPNAWASFRRMGETYERQNAASLTDEIKETLPPRWVRGWLHANPVDLRQPKPCALDR